MECRNLPGLPDILRNRYDQKITSFRRFRMQVLIENRSSVVSDRIMSFRIHHNEVMVTTVVGEVSLPSRNIDFERGLRIGNIVHIRSDRNRKRELLFGSSCEGNTDCLLRKPGRRHPGQTLAVGYHAIVDCKYLGIADIGHMEAENGIGLPGQLFYPHHIRGTVKIVSSRTGHINCHGACKAGHLPLTVSHIVVEHSCNGHRSGTCATSDIGRQAHLEHFARNCKRHWCSP